MKLQDWLGLLGLLISLVIVWQFRQILLLVFAAVVLAIALNQFVRWLSQKFRLARQQAVLLALICVFLGAGIVTIVVLPPFIKQFQQLIQLLPAGATRFGTWLNQLVVNPPAWFPERDFDLPPLTNLWQQLGTWGGRLFGNFFAFFSNSLGILLQLLLIVVLTLMFLADPQGYRGLALRLFPSFYRRRAAEIFDQCETVLLSWMQGACLTSAFVAGTSATALLLLGLPLVLVNALLAGLFNFIPNIGPTLSLVFPMLVALMAAPQKAIAVVVVYILIQNLESYWFSPMVMQKQVSLLPAATLIAQIFFATFLGFLGLVLALPLAVVSKIWLEEALIKDVFDRWDAWQLFPPAPLPTDTACRTANPAPEMTSPAPRPEPSESAQKE